MNPADDSLNDLAQSLTGELNQQAAEQRRAAIAEREALLATVPAVTELAMNHRVRWLLALSVVFLVVLGGWCLADEKARVAGALLLVLALASVRSLWLQREAGKQTLLRLTHDGVWFACLDDELIMRDLVQARVKDGRQMEITLTLNEGARLPGTRNAMGPWLPKAKVKHGTPPQVTLTLFGLEHRGKAMDAEQVMGLLVDYGAVALAKAELQLLRAGS